MKLSVLFVDDDSNVISGVKRMMHPMANEWDTFYANSGAEALEILNEKQVDVIISDIRMPGIDGTQLLKTVKQDYPQIIRITLSGYAHDSLALRNARIVHQSLVKPVNLEIVKNIIYKTFKLREKLNNSDLQKLINEIDDLPSLPEIYLKLEEEINRADTSIDRITNIIVNDPVITAKILQLTNSAFFGLPNRITNIKQGLNMLGVKVIQNLVLSIKLFKSMDQNHPNKDLYQEIWNHSNKVAFLAQKLGRLNNFMTHEIEDAFLGGLLHDIGKLIIIEQKNVIKFDEENTLEDYETNILHATHSDLGAYLLGIWGLPDTIVEAVAYHHDYSIHDFTNNSVSSIVFAANNIANESNIMPEEITSENFEEIISKFGKPFVEVN